MRAIKEPSRYEGISNVGLVGHGDAKPQGLPTAVPALVAHRAGPVRAEIARREDLHVVHKGRFRGSARLGNARLIGVSRANQD